MTTSAATCKVPGCGRPVRSRERCSRCYARLIRAESAGVPVVDPDYSRPADKKEPSVQVTLTIPLSVHDRLRGWPTKDPATGDDEEGKAMPPSAKAREVLVEWAKSNFPFQIAEE